MANISLRSLYILLYTDLKALLGSWWHLSFDENLEENLFSTVYVTIFQLQHYELRLDQVNNIFENLVCNAFSHLVSTVKANFNLLLVSYFYNVSSVKWQVP